MFHRHLAVSAAALLLAASPVAASTIFNWERVWSFRHNTPGQGLGAEINAFDRTSGLVFVSGDAGVDVLTNAGTWVRTLRLSAANDPVTNVAVYDGLVAIGGLVGSEGRIRFFDAATGTQIGTDLSVGTTPDQMTFTPDGKKLVVAIEGDPEVGGGPGQIAIIDMATKSVNALGFGAFAGNETAYRAGGALFRPGVAFADDIEPEFVTITPDGKKAVVTLQENNMIAIVDLTTETIVELIPLGLKDPTKPDSFFLHRSSSVTPNSLGLAGVSALWQPDGVVAFDHNGVTFLALANEGENLGNNRALPLDPSKVPAATVTALSNANVTPQTFWHLDLTDDGLADTIAYSGARSVSIRLMDGTLIWDSGNEVELMVRALGLLGPNSDRWTRLGIEPENLVVGMIGNQRWMFAGIERGRSIAGWNITNPLKPVFGGLIYDLSLGDAFAQFEGLTFIHASQSWDGKTYLLASAEGQGWTHMFRLGVVPEAGTWAMLITGFGLVGGAMRRRRAAFA
jgi:DNA-binding beta-propeller fold protein YncE